MLPSSIGRSDCSSALDIETSFPVPGLGGLGDGRRMILLQWTGTTRWPHKSAKRCFVKWASVSYSSTGMNEKRRAVKAKTSWERFSRAQCLCGARRAQLAQTVKTWGIVSAKAGRCMSHRNSRSFSVRTVGTPSWSWDRCDISHTEVQ